MRVVTDQKLLLMTYVWLFIKYLNSFWSILKSIHLSNILILHIRFIIKVVISLNIIWIDGFIELFILRNKQSMFINDFKSNIKIIHHFLYKNTCNLKVEIVLKDFVLFRNQREVLFKYFSFPWISKVFRVIRYVIMTELTMALSDWIITCSSVVHLSEFSFFKCIWNFIGSKHRIVINIFVDWKIVESILNTHEEE